MFLQNDNTALHYAALSGLKYCVEVSLCANLQLYFKKHSRDLFFLNLIQQLRYEYISILAKCDIRSCRYWRQYCIVAKLHSSICKIVDHLRFLFVQWHFFMPAEISPVWCPTVHREQGKADTMWLCRARRPRRDSPVPRVQDGLLRKSAILPLGPLNSSSIFMSVSLLLYICLL